MSYRVVVTRTASRQLAEKLPESAAAACVEFAFGPLAENPQRVGRTLQAPFAGQWRARRGVYRVRYRIDETEQVVYVLDIDPPSRCLQILIPLSRVREESVGGRDPGTASGGRQLPTARAR